MVPVNYLAVVVAAVIPMVLGFLWYGPLFGKQWAMMSGVSMDGMKNASKLNYLIMFVGSLLMAFVLSHTLIFASAYLHESGISAGLQTGFWNWLGFIVPATLGVVLWEGKSWKLWALNSGYYLVSLCLMGILLSLWQ